MKFKLFLVAVLLLVATVGSARAFEPDWPFDLYCCGPPPPEDTFGDAFRKARADQALNPDAGRDLAPVEGLDGRAAELIMDKYYKSFGKEGESSAGKTGGSYLPAAFIKQQGGK